MSVCDSDRPQSHARFVSQLAAGGGDIASTARADVHVHVLCAQDFLEDVHVIVFWS
jgi:hypothetical protein